MKLLFKIDFKKVFGFKVNVRIFSIQDIVLFVVESYKKRLFTHLKIYPIQETNDKNKFNLIKIFKNNIAN
jgi:hypothetical protein